jgi:hypothetical protein
MRHHPREVSHMVLNGRQECYPLRSQQLGLVLFPRLPHLCGSCLPILHQHVIELSILILIDSLHVLDQLWGIGGHVRVESMGIGHGATSILRRWTIHRGKIMLSSLSSARMSVVVCNGLARRMWCTMVRILSGTSVMWLPWEKKCMSSRWKEINMERIQVNLSVVRTCELNKRLWWFDSVTSTVSVVVIERGWGTQVLLLVRWTLSFIWTWCRLITSKHSFLHHLCLCFPLPFLGPAFSFLFRMCVSPTFCSAQSTIDGVLVICLNVRLSSSSVTILFRIGVSLFVSSSSSGGSVLEWPTIKIRQVRHKYAMNVVK